jgi:cell division transport system permease protein
MTRPGEDMARVPERLRVELRALVQGAERAFSSLLRRPLITLLSTGAVSVSLLLFSVVYLTAENVSRLAMSWGHGVQMVVYLEEGVTVERARAIGQVLKATPAVLRVDYVPEDVAYERLKSSLGERKDLLSGVEVGFLPASLEVTLTDGVRDVASVSPIVTRLKKTAGVEEVEFLGDWVDRLAALLRGLRGAALALALLVAAACTYVVAGTIKLGVYARRDELEIAKLVGATDGFVRLPLMVEGTLQGMLGASAAVGLLYALYRMGAPALERALSAALGEMPLLFLAPADVGAMVCAGALLGLFGSWVAIGRYADA